MILTRSLRYKKLCNERMKMIDFVKERRSHIVNGLTRRLPSFFCRCLPGASILSFLVLSPVFAQGKLDEPPFMYRYTDQNGRQVVSQQIPPDGYKNGYQALDKAGRVLYKVDPPPTEEEKQAYSDKKMAHKMQREQHLRDQNLLRVYSSPEDATRAKERKLKQLDVTIEINEAKISQLRLEYEYILEQAAKREKLGLPVIEQMTQDMASLEDQMKAIEVFIEGKNAEKNSITNEYDALIARLNELFEQSEVSNMSGDY